MTEFEIQRGLREMKAPRMPARDLWPAIAGRIEGGASTATRRAPRRRWIPLAAAAGTLLAIAGGLALFALRERAAQTPVFADSMPLHIERITPQQARAAAERTGVDPRLAGASVVVDAARAELQQAIEQHPDAVFLVSLLNRTNAQRLKLEQMGARAG